MSLFQQFHGDFHGHALVAGGAGVQVVAGVVYMIGKGVFADFEKPVTAAAALWNGSDFDYAVEDAAL